MVETIVTLQITILTYMGLGIFLQKSGMMRESDQVFLSELVLNFLLPISVFVSFVENITRSVLAGLLTVLVIAAVLEIALAAVTRFHFQKNLNDRQWAVARYSYLVSNGGLIGTPVIEGLFGSVGVMVCNVFLIPTRIMAYVAGESIFNPAIHKSGKQILRTIATNRIILAMVAAVVLNFTGLSLPAPIFTALKTTGKALSPFSLMVVGSMLAHKMVWSRSDLKKVAEISLLRLLVIPLLTLVCCLLLRIDAQTTAISTLLLGMPAGSTSAIFAKKYNGDSMFASMVVFVTTVASTGSLVFLMMLIEFLC